MSKRQMMMCPLYAGPERPFLKSKHKPSKSNQAAFSFGTATSPSLVLGLPHPGVNGGAKGGKGDAAAGHGLGPRVAGEDAAGEAAGGDAVADVVCGAQALDSALDAGEEGADLAKVLGHGEGARAHVLEAELELLAEGQRRHVLAGGVCDGAAKGGVVRHLRARRAWLEGVQGRGSGEAMSSLLPAVRVEKGEREGVAYGSHEHAKEAAHAKAHDARHY